MKKYQESLRYFFDNFDYNNVKIISNLINKNKNIYFIGIGKSYNLALQTSDLFKSIGYKSFCLNSEKLLHGDLGVIDDDLIFIISKSGNTKELINLMPFLINNYLIGIFCNNNSKLSKYCNLNIVLPCCNELDKFNLIPTTSYTIFNIFFNLLVCELSENLTLEQYGKNHPAGDIGKKSNIKIINIMKNIDLCSIMNNESSIKDCIINMNSKRNTCCIFLNKDNTIYGLITDYDIRKYLEKNDNINYKITNIINKEPYVLNNNKNVNDINHNFLSGIPVINEEKQLIGLLDYSVL